MSRLMHYWVISTLMTFLLIGFMLPDLSSSADESDTFWLYNLHLYKPCHDIIYVTRNMSSYLIIKIETLRELLDVIYQLDTYVMDS